MKRCNALKDPTIKYPRAANRLLDLGMLLVVFGCIAICANILGMHSFFWSSLSVFVVGLSIMGGAELVASMKNDPKQDEAADRQPHLKLVK